MSDFLSTRELCRELKVTRNTLNYWRGHPRLEDRCPQPEQIGHTLLWSQEAVTVFRALLKEIGQRTSKKAEVTA